MSELGKVILNTAGDTPGEWCKLPRGIHNVEVIGDLEGESIQIEETMDSSDSLNAKSDSELLLSESKKFAVTRGGKNIRAVKTGTTTDSVIVRVGVASA